MKTYTKNDMYKLCLTLQTAAWDDNILISKHAYRKAILKLRSEYSHLMLTSFVSITFQPNRKLGRAQITSFDGLKSKEEIIEEYS